MTKKKSVVDSAIESVNNNMTVYEGLEDTLNLNNDSSYLKAKAALFVGRFSKEVLSERMRQIEKFGSQSHIPDKPESLGSFVPDDKEARDICDVVFRNHKGTWFNIHYEEFCEAFCAVNTAHLRKELVQLIATLTAHVQAIDERSSERMGK
jgi:hypothetical protein